VVAGRKSDHAALLFFFRKGANLVSCAAKFESSDPLKILALEKDLSARRFVKCARSHDGCAMNERGDAIVGFFD
jgi:hypothetical protein